MSVSLKAYNTFGIDGSADKLFVLESIEQLAEVQQLYSDFAPNVLVLGGGSNVLFTEHFSGLVILNRLRGRKIIEETPQHITLEIAAGENWHETVLYSVANNWGGIENLSLIPGCIGAAPIQNIGAYGAEVKDVITSVQTMKWSDGSLKDFSLEECQFGYRDSFFKQHKGEYLILSVSIQLSKNPSNFKISYGDIQDTLKQMEVWIPNVKAISDAVIKIRSSKLPDPKVLGNAGSFFKNPVISFEKAQELKETYPLIPLYPQQDSSVKVAAGWLIEQCGWKGKICGNTGNHAKQSLVIVNYGNASGQEIKAHALKVQQSVKEKFGVHLEPEVNFVPN